MVNFRFHDLREGRLTADRAAIRGGSHLSAEPQSDECVLCVKMFDDAVDRLGHIVEELDGLALSMTTAIAEIEAEGDRIDRLQADNRAMLDDLLNGS
jgi:hypothetical protein